MQTQTPPNTHPGGGSQERALFGRWAGIAGIAYAVCLFGGHLIHQGVGSGELDAYSDYLADDGRLRGAAAQACMTIVALLAFIVFLTGFVRRHRHADGDVAAVAVVAGIAYITLWTAGVGLVTAAGMAHLGGDPQLAPESVQAFDTAGSYLLYWAALSVAGIWVLASTRLASLADASGPWLTRYGYLAGVALLPGFIWLGLPLHIIWVLAVSIGVLRRG